jgi:hypothetical protein
LNATQIKDAYDHELAHCNGWSASHPGGYYNYPKRK